MAAQGGDKKRQKGSPDLRAPPPRRPVRAVVVQTLTICIFGPNAENPRRNARIRCASGGRDRLFRGNFQAGAWGSFGVAVAKLKKKLPGRLGLGAQPIGLVHQSPIAESGGHKLRFVQVRGALWPGAWALTATVFGHRGAV